MKKQDGMPFGARGPEGMNNEPNKANNLDGAKGGGMKHVVSPGADPDAAGDAMMDDKKKQMLMMLIARMRAGQGGGQPPMGAPMGGGNPMGGGM